MPASNPVATGPEPPITIGGLGRPVDTLPGVGPRTAEILTAAGVRTLGDLLRHLPSGYRDRRHPVSPARAVPGSGAVEGRVAAVRWLRLRGRRGGLLVACIEGEGAQLEARWHGGAYLRRRLEEGQRVVLVGEVRSARRGRGLEMLDPVIDVPAGDGGGTAPGLEAIYPPLGSLGPARIAKLLAAALKVLEEGAPPPDPLPPELRRRHRLPGFAEALEEVHRPSVESDVEELRARRSLGWQRWVYGELLEEQVQLARRRRWRRQIVKGRRYALGAGAAARLRRWAPFALTGAQERVLAEILADLGSPWPMARLLQGDVGCGKTAVALLALALTAESGHQGVLMAPTEVLAEQLYDTARRWFGQRWPISLRTSSSPGSPEAALVVGTHALIEEAVSFERLALVVVDEQHRFGVEQRRRLLAKGRAPDLLLMTATPIPRSLALTTYGDLDLSRLEEAPPGRAGVVTECWPQRRRPEAYRRLAKALDAGAQAYVVVPAIAAGAAGRVGATIEATAERLGETLATWPGAVLHGRLTSAQQNAALRGFVAGEVRWLLATTVVEVGLDVPAATVMVIEGAERFGLAQLHQLRGRVRRGEQPGWCLALHGRLDAGAKRRLEIFAGCDDGFLLAQEDLALRGPGELLGRRQSGTSGLDLDPQLHDRWLEAAVSDAAQLELRCDGELEKGP